MATERGSILGEKIVRIVLACAVTLIGVGVLATRDTPGVDWPLVLLTVAVYWIWVELDERWLTAVWATSFVVPMVLNLVESTEEISMLFAVLGVTILASSVQNRRLVAAVIVTVIGVYGILIVTEALQHMAWQNWLFGALFGAAVGEILFRFSKLVAELQRTRSLVADQAAARERRRIARDVHDLVGHSLTVVMLHVTGARHVLRSDPDEAERALEQAETAGRDSLAEIRRTVGLLAEEEAGDAANVPTPELTDIPALVEEFSHAGATVELHIDGPLELADGPVGVAGYRIAQEALTNAARHAPGTPVVVTVAVDATQCTLQISNRGGGVGQLEERAGYGLVSMRERARSVGGSLIAGPTAGAWMVEATLPLTSPSVVS